MQEQWNELLATALLGTEQRKCTVVAPELEFLNTLPIAALPQEHEWWVLLASAVVATYCRAGQIPLTTTINVSPALPEIKPYCSGQVAARLASVLAEARTMEPFAEEMLLILADQGRIVPPILLPDLLTWALRNKQRRALIAPVVGARGQWLTQINPEWENALRVDTEEFDNHVEAMQRITGQQALYNTLSITDNIFNKGLNIFNQQNFGAHHRLIQLTVEKLTTLAKPVDTYVATPDVNKIAVAVPMAALPELIGQLHRLLATKEFLPWLTTLVDRLEFRQQMLEELTHE